MKPDKKLMKVLFADDELIELGDKENKFKPVFDKENLFTLTNEVIYFLMLKLSLDKGNLN